MVKNDNVIIKYKNKYNIIEVVIIMIITAICSILITIKATYINKSTKKDIVNRADLSELIETYNSIVDEYYTDVNKAELIDAAIEGMVEYLGDPYSAYMDEKTKEAFNEELEGEYVGMGAEIVLKNNNVYINKVFKNSPAQKVGIKANDIIKKVANEEVSKLTLEQISSKIKGIPGTKVKVVIERNKKQIEYEITRAKVDIESVTSQIINKNNKKIGLIVINTFANNTYQQFKTVEKELEDKKVDSLIVDLRGNSGGYLATVQSIAELFLEKGQVIYQLEVKDKITKVKAETDKKIKLKTVVLVNGGSASASEILAATLKENYGSEIIGTKTFGKGKVQKAQTLTSGAMIKYTIQNWLTPTGKQIDGVGIKPTIEIKLNESYFKNPSNETDNQLQKAIEIISK